MTTRRQILIGLLASPAIIIPKFAMADRIDSLLDGLEIVADNTGSTRVAGGRTLGRINEQVRHMNDHGGFDTRQPSDSGWSSNGIRNAAGYSVARFREDSNVCFSLSVNGDPWDTDYAGAMTMLEGPNLVGMAALTETMRRKNLSRSAVRDVVWPTYPSKHHMTDPGYREVGIVTFEEIAYSADAGVYLDRDVLHGRNGTAVLRYGHNYGKPTGDGEAAWIGRNGELMLRLRFDYSHAI